MIVQCPQCNTKFRVDDQLISPEGSQARCSRCKDVFTVFPEKPEEVGPETGTPDEDVLEAPGEELEEDLGALDEDEDFLGLGEETEDEIPVVERPEDLEVPTGTEEADFEEEDDLLGLDDEDALLIDGMEDEEVPPEEPPPAEEEEFDIPGLEEETEEEDEGEAFEGESFGEEPPEEDEPMEGEKEFFEETEEAEEKPAKKRSGLTLFLLFLLLIAVVGAAVYFYYPQIKPYIPETVRGWLGEETADTTLSQKSEDGEDGVKNISLLDVRQYFVTNDKIGQLFVVEGRAVNGYETPKELIKLQATLYDNEGNVVESKQFLCGNTASLFQLQVMSRDELQATLNAKVGILTNNTNLQPGDEVPFMTVFYSPPEAVQEFGVKVVEAKDTPNS